MFAGLARRVCFCGVCRRRCVLIWPGDAVLTAADVGDGGGAGPVCGGARLVGLGLGADITGYSARCAGVLIASCQGLLLFL
jgi:hypothetical protein